MCGNLITASLQNLWTPWPIVGYRREIGYDTLEIVGPVRRTLIDFWNNLWKYSPNTILNVQSMLFIMHEIFWHANQSRCLRGDGPPSLCVFLTGLLWGRFPWPGMLPWEPWGIFPSAKDVLKGYSYGD